MNTIQTRKKILTVQANELENKLNQNAIALKSKLHNASLWALALGAGFMLTYYVVNKFFFTKSKKKIVVLDAEGSSSQYLPTKENHTGNYLYSMIKEQMVLFLLLILKQKLAEYINSADGKQVVEKILNYLPYRNNKQTTTQNNN